MVYFIFLIKKLASPPVKIMVKSPKFWVNASIWAFISEIIPASTPKDMLDDVDVPIAGTSSVGSSKGRFAVNVCMAL